MLLNNYLRSFFELEQLNQGQFLIRYLTLALISSFILIIDQKLFSEINIGISIVPQYYWSENGYFFKKLILFCSFLTLWLGLRRFKSILNAKTLGLLPFSIFALLAIVSVYYKLESIFLILLFLIPTRKGSV